MPIEKLESRTLAGEEAGKKRGKCGVSRGLPDTTQSLTLLLYYVQQSLLELGNIRNWEIIEPCLFKYMYSLLHVLKT